MLKFMLPVQLLLMYVLLFTGDATAEVKPIAVRACIISHQLNVPGTPEAVYDALKILNLYF